jgi:hypothetical protein
MFELDICREESNELFERYEANFNSLQTRNH